MTVGVETSEVDYAGNGATVAFSVPFPFTNNDQIVATLLLSGDTVPTTQVEGTDYTLTGALGATGTLTMLVAPPAASTLHIERTVPILQETAFRTQGSFSPATHENALDYLTFVCQMIWRAVVALQALASLVPVGSYSSVVVTKQFTTDAGAVEDGFPMDVDIGAGLTPVGVMVCRAQNITDPAAVFTTAVVCVDWTPGASLFTANYITGLEPGVEYLLTFHVLTEAS